MRIGACKHLALVLLLAACSGSETKPDNPDTVQMKSQAIQEIEEVEARRPPPVEEAPPPEEEEELAIEMFELGDAAVRTSAGLEIRLLSGSPSWVIEFDQQGRKTVARHEGDPLYIEGIAFSHMFVVTGDGAHPSVTLRSGELPPPLTPDEAFALARRERAARLGCDGTSEETKTLDNGTSVLRVLDASGVETCRIVVGRFTRSVL